MADTLTITLAQLNQKVGDLAANAAAMLTVRSQAEDSDLIVFPEMQLIGYPPEDLLLKPALIERAAIALEWAHCGGTSKAPPTGRATVTGEAGCA